MSEHEYVISNRNIEEFEVEDIHEMVRDGVLNGYVTFEWVDYPFEDEGFGNSYSLRVIVDFDTVTFERATNGYMPSGWTIVGQTGRWIDYEYRRADEYTDDEWVEYIIKLAPEFMNLPEAESFVEADGAYVGLLEIFEYLLADEDEW